MKRHVYGALLVLMSMNNLLQALTQQDLQILRAARLGGAVIGTTAGAAAGATAGWAAGRKAMFSNKFSYTRKKGKGSDYEFVDVITPKQGAIIGGGVGAAIGSLGGFASEKAAILYLAKKYKVTPRIIQASAWYPSFANLNDAGLREELIAVQRKDKAVTKNIIIGILTQLFGTNWHEQITTLMHTYLSIIAHEKNDVAAYEAFKQQVGYQQAEQFKAAISVGIVPFALLYFNKPIPDGMYRLEYSLKQGVMLTKALMHAVDIQTK